MNGRQVRTRAEGAEARGRGFAMEALIEEVVKPSEFSAPRFNACSFWLEFTLASKERTTDPHFPSFLCSPRLPFARCGGRWLTRTIMRRLAILQAQNPDSEGEVEGNGRAARDVLVHSLHGGSL